MKLKETFKKIEETVDEHRPELFAILMVATLALIAIVDNHSEGNWPYIWFFGLLTVLTAIITINQWLCPEIYARKREVTKANPKKDVLPDAA